MTTLGGDRLPFIFFTCSSRCFHRRLENRKIVSNRRICLYSVLQERGKILTEFQNKERPKREAKERPRAPSEATINFDQLCIGQELTARILKQKAYGCFVDIGLGQDVLVHISELSTHFVKDILETFSVGDTLTVYVKSIDIESRKVWLTTLKHRQFVSQRKPIEKVQVEDVVKGNIVRLTESGAFVDFGCFCDGFLSFTEVPQERMSSTLALGDEVETRVIRVDQRTRKIWLSIRQVDLQIRHLIQPPLELVLERPTQTNDNTTDDSQ